MHSRLRVVLPLVVFCLSSLFATAQTVSPSVVSFGSLTLGSASAANVVTLTTQNAKISNITASATGDFQIAATTCTTSLKVKSSCSYSLVFKPTGLGARSGNLTITYTGGNSSQRVSLSGNGTSPTTLSATGLSFGPIQVGATSSATSVTVTNNQTTVLANLSVSISGDYSFTTTCSGSLAPAASCSATVTFSPTSSGTRNGTLLFSHNAVTSPDSVQLSGTGIAVALSASPSSLTFASQEMGSSSGPQVITVSNPSSLAANIGSVGITGEFFQTNNCVGTLAAGSSCSVSVTFAPTTEGMKTASITVTSSANNSPLVIGASGTATPPPPHLVSIAVAPAESRLTAGSSQQFTATGTLSNGATEDLTASAAWMSSDSDAVTIDATGLADAKKPGTAVITATASGFFSSSTVTVTKAAGSVPTGGLTYGRELHSSIKLNDGRVVVIGGIDANGQGILPIEIYDPVTGQWQVTGTLNATQGRPDLWLLPDGRVMVIGRSFGPVEVYDPSTGASETRNFTSYEASAQLADGRILMLSVDDGSGAGARPAIYNPSDDSLVPTGAMNIARMNASATLLQDGRVLIVGGYAYPNDDKQAELFDPLTNTFSLTGSLPVQRQDNSLTVLSDGRVLIAGGYGSDLLPTDAYLYDPATGQFSSAGNMATSRYYHRAVLMNDGRVMIVGGFAWFFDTGSVEIYDPATNSFSSSRELLSRRGQESATLLDSGKVLVAGGSARSLDYTPPPALSTAELYGETNNLISIAISPAETVIPYQPAGYPQTTWTAIGTFDDGSVQPLTALMYWTCSNPDIGYMYNYSGQLQTGSGYATGTGVITGTLANLQATAAVTVQ